MFHINLAINDKGGGACFHAEALVLNAGQNMGACGAYDTNSSALIMSEEGAGSTRRFQLETSFVETVEELLIRLVHALPRCCGKRK